jgi:hypothetical protein
VPSRRSAGARSSSTRSVGEVDDAHALELAERFGRQLQAGTHAGVSAERVAGADPVAARLRRAAASRRISQAALAAAVLDLRSRARFTAVAVDRPGATRLSRRTPGPT